MSRITRWKGTYFHRYVFHPWIWPIHGYHATPTLLPFDRSEIGRFAYLGVIPIIEVDAPVGTSPFDYAVAHLHFLLLVACLHYPYTKEELGLHIRIWLGSLKSLSLSISFILCRHSFFSLGRNLALMPTFLPGNGMLHAQKKEWDLTYTCFNHWSHSPVGISTFDSTVTSTLLFVDSLPSLPCLHCLNTQRKSWATHTDMVRVTQVTLVVDQHHLMPTLLPFAGSELDAFAYPSFW